MENTVLKAQRIGWIDFLRVIACFLVVWSHCGDGFIAQFDNNPLFFTTGVLSGSLVRPCVPIFVMMTGVLLLPVQGEMGPFYKKRIGRILYPLIFWSILLPLLYTSYVLMNPATTNPLATQDVHSIPGMLRKMYTFLFNFNSTTVPIWYLYMLIGLYLIMPILSAWLRSASKYDIRLFLLVWGLSLLLPYLKMFAPMLGFDGYLGHQGLWGECDWNAYGSLYYVSGFVGYLVLAYYLVTYPLQWSWRKLLSITIPMFCVGYFITSYGYFETQKYYPGNYAYLEIVWLFSGINVFMMTFPVFVIAQKINMQPQKWLSHLASFTFGIYLAHYAFVIPAYDLFDVADLHPIVRIALMACFSFGCAYLLIYLMSRLPFFRRFVL